MRRYLNVKLHCISPKQQTHLSACIKIKSPFHLYHIPLNGLCTDPYLNKVSIYIPIQIEPDTHP